MTTLLSGFVDELVKTAGLKPLKPHRLDDALLALIYAGLGANAGALLSGGAALAAPPGHRGETFSRGSNVLMPVGALGGLGLALRQIHKAR